VCVCVRERERVGYKHIHTHRCKPYAVGSISHLHLTSAISPYIHISIYPYLSLGGGVVLGAAQESLRHHRCITLLSNYSTIRLPDCRLRLSRQQQQRPPSNPLSIVAIHTHWSSLVLTSHWCLYGNAPYSRGLRPHANKHTSI
jgi:hypothetical protein